LKRGTVSLGVAAIVLYVTIVALVWFRQEFLIFHPVPLAADFQFPLPGVVEEKVAVDGAELSALHLKLPDPKGVVFFLHGNSGNLQSWFTSVDFYRRTNYDLFILDYRGFGKSSGKIESEAQLHADVRRAWDQIAPQYAGKKKVIYGRSLGTGLAAKLSSDVQSDLTVLVSPYASLMAMGELRYPWLPSAINRYPMRSDQWLPKIPQPVVILHGDLDSTIPIQQGEFLKGLRDKTELLRVPGAGHNDIHKFPFYLDSLADRLIKL
jgi:hypothetical protein